MANSGLPKLGKVEVRTARVRDVRVTTAELSRMRANAKLAGLTQSEFIRIRCCVPLKQKGRA